MNDFSDLKSVKYNFPENSSDFIGEYIVFFSEDKKPKILFHSISPEEAYKQSELIEKKYKRNPTIVRVTDNNDEVSHLFFHFA